MKINQLSELNKKLISAKLAKDIFSEKTIKKVFNEEDADFIINLSESLKINIKKQGKQIKSITN